MTALKSFARSCIVAAALACTAASAVSAADLTQRDRSIVVIASNTATGDMQALTKNLEAGLASGLTVNEIKEILVQLYAYTGFPRSLNAINNFMKVMQSREAAGIKDHIGREPSAVPAGLDKDDYGARVRAKLGGRTEIPPPSGYQVFSPAIDQFLKEHLFCDIFIRDNLDAKSRELATIGALASMTGTEGQLRFHLGAALNTGVTADEMEGFIDTIKTEVGNDRAEAANSILQTILKQHAAK